MQGDGWGKKESIKYGSSPSGVFYYWARTKVVPVQAMKVCRGSRDTMPFIPDLGTRWR
jgi:hypothetical protein